MLESRMAFLSSLSESISWELAGMAASYLLEGPSRNSPMKPLHLNTNQEEKINRVYRTTAARSAVHSVNAGEKEETVESVRPRPGGRGGAMRGTGGDANNLTENGCGRMGVALAYGCAGQANGALFDARSMLHVVRPVWRAVAQERKGASRMRLVQWRKWHGNKLFCSFGVLSI